MSTGTDAGPAKAAADKDVRQLARRGSASLLGSGVTAVAQLVLTVAVARGLTRQDAGLFFSATSLFLILGTLARLGTPTGLVWALSGQRARGEVAQLRATIRIALPPVLVAGAVIAVVLAVGAHPVARLLLPSSAPAETVDRMATILRAMAVFVPVAAVYDAVCAATRGLGVMRPTVYVERIFRPLLQCVAVGLLAWFAGSVVVTLAWLIPYVLALVLAARMLRVVLRRNRTGAAAVDPGAVAERGAELDPEPAAESAAGSESAAGAEPAAPGPSRQRVFWRFTGPRALANLAQTVQQRLDIVLVGAIRGPREAAVYAAATRFLVLGQAAGLAISLAVQPNLGAALGVGDRQGAGTVYRLATAWLVLVTWPIYLFAFTAPELILAVFGSGYGAGTGVIRILAATMLVATACGMVDMVLTMAGRTWWNLANVGVGVTVFVVLDLLLIPPFGIMGAAVGWSVAILVNNLLPLAQIGLAMGLHPFGRATLLAAGWAFVACGVLPALVLLPLGGALWQLGAVLVGALLVYAAGLYLLRAPLELVHLPLPGRRRRRGPKPA